MISLIIKNNIKKDFKSIVSIFLIMLISFTFIFLSISMSNNTRQSIEKRLEENNFGDLLVLTSGRLLVEPTLNYLMTNENVESVANFEIIYSSYEFGNIKSDVDAIIFKSTDRKFEDLSPAEIALPVSIKGILGIDVNDEITINIRRDIVKKYKVKYFFEDEVFGSSMIGIKRFYLSDSSYDEIKKDITNNDIENLAKSGNAFFIKGENDADYKSLSNIWYDNPNISNSIEHIYSRNTIISYMSLLINIFIAFLSVFSILLTIVSIVIIYYSFKNSITYDKKSISNLKILGYKSNEILKIYLMEWNIPIVIALVTAYVLAKPIMKVFYNMTYIANGMMYESDIFVAKSLLIILAIIIFINIVIVINLKNIYNIKPVETRLNADFTNKKYAKIKTNSILDISIREVVSRKKNYIMLILICILLSIFNNQIYRIYTWLDNGKGLMNSFNPTDMDYGVQSIKDVDIEEVIKDVDNLNGIEYTYMLGMTNLNVEGYNLRANVSSDTERFHILNGRTIKNSDEILITDIVSNNLSKKIGDTIAIRGTKGEENYKVVGIYECANEMGDNVGISKEGFERISDTQKNFYCYHFFLKNKNTDNLTKFLSDKYGARIYTHTNTWSGLESIVNAMNVLLKILVFLTIVIALVITIIQVYDTLKNEKESLSIYKILGFNKKDISLSFAIRFIMVSTIGVLIGIVIVKIFSDGFINYLFRNYGICAYKSHFTVYNAILSMFIVALFGTLSYCFSSKTLKITRQ